MLKFIYALTTLTIAALMMLPEVVACTRIVYHGPDGRNITGRNMDFKDPMVSNLWVFPRGMERHGVAGERSLKWTSKYGSLAVSGYDISTVDGMNEAGMNASLLWLNATSFPKDDGKTPRMSLAIWAQFYLDQFATVAEAVAYTRNNPIDVVSGEVPGRPGNLAPLHLTLSDVTGDSAILEWIDGKLDIHHHRTYQVVTNDPPYNEQLANQKYWSAIDPLKFLPGSGRSEDRFVRAGFYVNAVTQSADPRIAAAAVFSVIRNVSAPYGVSIPEAPNLSTTRWRVVADHKNKRFYGESATSPNIFWVDLEKLDFTKGASVQKLDLGVDMNRVLTGESSDQFVVEKPFDFMATQ
ncbi:linear amide C-N hydrolase [Candidatus Berkiella cookevillensis]|uniref:Linear amide C-N hydrolase n=1 Tax=Candidatus Berkiella cookevillensis TaxID=437022 RepID=A0A0Q9Y9U0_9GAMM|nr:linear amide C-N hydrolase [Candidatus Berkiella cookevillensis]MCS5708001.1 linear amide C-N hydrolase [Candidatus Berkiella cookevillensis]